MIFSSGSPHSFIHDVACAGGLVNPAYESHPGDNDSDGFTDSDQEDASEPTEVEKVRRNGCLSQLSTSLPNVGLRWMGVTSCFCCPIAMMAVCSVAVQVGGRNMNRN